MFKQKTVLGLIETVHLYLPNNNIIKFKAKVDTGAHFTALDASIAKKLGYTKSLKLFKKYCPKFNIDKNNFKDIRKQLNKKYKKELIKKVPGLVDVKLIPATNGFSIRPYFAIKFKLKNKLIKTKASLVDRSHMKYPFLLGKNDMKGFLINPTKHDYNTL